MSADFAIASLIPAAPANDESIVLIMLFCNLYSRYPPLMKSSFVGPGPEIINPFTG